MPPLSIMIKPASSLCNMNCTYCFYHDVSEHRTSPSFGIMEEKTLESIIVKALNFADGHQVAFAFQGGEPLLAGLPFFKKFTQTVKRHNERKSPIFFSMQTNGSLINDEWARFFHSEIFLLGLSLDGNKEMNSFRIMQNGSPSFHKILKGAELLEKHKVDFNILTVLTGRCAKNIEDIYRYFRSKGFRHLQFIPCLRPFDEDVEGELYMSTEEYAEFLIRAFNLYVKDYVSHRYTSVRQFDNFVRLFLDQKAEQCGMNGHCTYQFVVEGNGNTYPCDFYCTDEWLLGNINEEGFSDFANGEKAKSFIRESLQIDERCKACPYFHLCKGGGCKRNRADRDYCESYKKFFSACLPLFHVFRAEKKGRQD